MTLNIQLNGQDYTNFIDASVVRSIDTVSGAFSFTSTVDQNNLFPIKLGDAVKIIVDGIQVIDGFIEKINVSYSPDSHVISVGGRDKLADLIDSSTGDIKEFTGSVSLVDIAKNILANLGLSDIEVIDNTTGVRLFDAFDITSAEVGKNAFEFLELYARKRQVLLTTDGLGNLVLTQASSNILPFKLKNIVGGIDNNIKNATLDLDFTNRFNTYTVQSQLNPFFLDIGSTPQNNVEQSGQATDSDIRATRILEFNAEESSDGFTSADRAKWESNIRRAKSLLYTPVVQGHSVDNTVWSPNNLVEVEDQFTDIEATLFIQSVRYDQSLNMGSTTTLGLTFKDAYTLQAEQDAREATTDNQGFGFVL
jgi:prophage tail gpP-like protein